MPNVTVAFDELVKGWTSEFTFVPDSGVSLNNKFYTFNNGRLWEHNDPSVDRNTFYGITSDTVVKFVFNSAPTVVKNYKTLGYEGVGNWDAVLETNLETGEVKGGWYLEKEGKKYSWIRGEDTGVEIPDLGSASVQGIGSAATIATNQVSFSGRIPQVSVGDLVFRIEGDAIFQGRSTETPEIVGRVTSTTTNSISYDGNALGGTTTVVEPQAGDFIITAKSNQEKSGIIGFYNVVTMTNSDVVEAELFSANTSVFISTK